MQLDGPTFIPKAALTVGRVLHQPFEVPTEMTKSALLQSGVTHDAIGKLNEAAASVVENLQPRGPAKLLLGLFDRIDKSLVSSADQAKKATETFWVPFSNGAHQVGHSVSNPFALFYAKRAGFEVPAEPADATALLASITDPDPDSTKFPGANWPTPDAGGETPPDGETPPPSDGETPPPSDGETPPPSDGETPPSDGEAPPTDGGETPPADGETPPAEGETPPTDGGEAPPAEDGETPPAEGETPPADGGEGIADGAVTEGASDVPEGARGIAPVDIVPTEDTAAPLDPAAPQGAVVDAAAGAQDMVPVDQQVPVTTPAPIDEPAPVAPPVVNPEG